MSHTPIAQPKDALRMTMTRTTLGLAALLGLAAGPALAQVQQANPNAANQSLSTMSTNRTMQQGQTGQNNTTMMNMERSQNTPQAPSAPAVVPHGGVGR
jgi:hypothetical protein